jgi:hypothetical protein
LLSTILLLAALATAPTSQAATDRMSAQQPLVAAAEKIQSQVERGSYPGFAGIVLEDRQVALWWKGAVPTSLVLPPAVVVKSAAHSLTELRAASAKIRSNIQVGPGNPVHGVKIPADGSGLVLSAQPGTTFTAAADVPVRVVHEEPLAPVSRPDDSAPWKGGARIWNRNANTICTSGFGVRNSANARYVLTAAHCGQAGSRFDDGTGEFIGNVGPRHADHDIELVPTSNTTNRMYVGGGTSNTTQAVTGWGHVFVGQYLCQSGVTSAEATGAPVCNLKVLFFYADREDLVEAEQMNGQPAARGGDSGGPVYSTSSGGVVANGTVTRTAGARLGFQDFATAFNDFGVYIP